MEKNKNTIKIILLVGAVCLLFFSVGVFNTEEEIKYEDANYIGLAKLGLVPSAYSRDVYENDIDTGIKLRDGDDIYSLIESRTFQTGDYGRTFLVKIN